MKSQETNQSAAPGGAWYLRALHYPGLIFRIAPTEPPLIVGRGPECDIRLTNLSISRKHAMLEFHQGSLEIVDLDSRNGVLLDGKKVQRSLVQSGQIVQLGDCELIFTFESPVEEGVTQPLLQQARENMLTALTPAQRRVAMLILEDHTEQVIAESLNLSYFTVHNHVKEIYRKCEVQSRAQFLSKYRGQSKDSS